MAVQTDKLTISGNTQATSLGYGASFQPDASYGTTPQLTISSGTFTGTSQSGVSFSGNGTALITGGTFNGGPHGISFSNAGLSSSTVNITGGTFSGSTYGVLFNNNNGDFTIGGNATCTGVGGGNAV